jgi:hypothetical protein
MHNLIALSLALPGTPLHGLNEFEAGSRSTSPRDGRRRPARRAILAAMAGSRARWITLAPRRSLNSRRGVRRR